METEYLPAVEIEPSIPARSSVIWLHGLGADGHDFEPIVPLLGLDRDNPVRFVFPHAPSLPVTVNAGMVMPAWYDVRGTDLRDREDRAGIERSAESIRVLIEREESRGVDSRRVVLAGFSQGGAMAIHVGLRYPRPLAGILALSAYLLLPDDLEAEGHPANREVPVFQAHGTLDPMVSMEWGRRTREVLSASGHPTVWRTYPMMHEVCPDEIRDVGSWLNRILSS